MTVEGQNVARARWIRMHGREWSDRAARRPVRQRKVVGYVLIPRLMILLVRLRRVLALFRY